MSQPNPEFANTDSTASLASQITLGTLNSTFKAENTDEPLGMGSGDPDPSPLACLASVLPLSCFTSPAH